MNARTPEVSPVGLSLAAGNTAVLRVLAEGPWLDPISDLARKAGVEPKNIGRTLSNFAREGLVLFVLADDPKPNGEGDRWEITDVGRHALTVAEFAAGNAPAAQAAEPSADADNDTIMLLHHQVRPNPLNPRRIDLTRDRDRRELDELKASIVSAGDVYNNLVVFPADVDGVHELSAGERRWRAVGELIAEGFWPRDRRLRAIQKPHTAGQTSFIALVENKQRADLPILEEARAWKTLIDDTPGLSARAAALKVGRDPRTVQQMLQVLREGSPKNIARCEDPDDDYTWEDLRRSVQQPTEQGDGDDGAQQVDLEEAVAEAGPPTWRDRIEYFSAEVQAAALAEASRAEPGQDRIVATPLSGKTTIEGESWPDAPTEVMKTPWEGYPQAGIELSMSDKGRWYAALRTQAGAPNYSGQSGPWQVYTSDAVFPTRADVLAFACDAIVARLGDVWGKKRKLQDWLVEVQKPPLRAMSDGFPPARLPLVEMQAKFLATEPRLIVRGRPAVRIDYWKARNDSLFGGLTRGYQSGGPLVGAENLRGGGTCAFITELGEEWLRQNGWWLTPETVAEQLAVWREDQTRLHPTTAARLAATGWLTEWLVEPQASGVTAPAATEDTGSPAPAERELSSVEALALLELVHAGCEAHDAGIDHGQGWVRAGKYWNDATFHQLKTLGLVDVTHTFTDDGPHVRVLDAGMARLGDEFPTADLEAIEDEDLDAAREACGVTEWTGPGYVTPWLNRELGTHLETPESVEVPNPRASAHSDLIDSQEAIDDDALDAFIEELREHLAQSRGLTSRWHAVDSSRELAALTLSHLASGGALDAVACLMGLISREGGERAGEHLEAVTSLTAAGVLKVEARPEPVLAIHVGDVVHKGTEATSYRVLGAAEDRKRSYGPPTPAFNVQTLRHGKVYGGPTTLALEEIVGFVRKAG